MSLDKVEELKAAFEMFDFDRSGRLTVSKLGAVLNDKFGQAFTQDDLSYMLRQFGDGNEVDFFTFANSLDSKMADARYSEAFGDAFDLFDTNKQGELSKDDLQAGMLKLGENLTDAEAEEMLKIARKRDDFIKAMSNSVSASGPVASSPAGAPQSAAPAAAPVGAASVAAAAAARPAGGMNIAAMAAAAAAARPTAGASKPAAGPARPAGAAARAGVSPSPPAPAGMPPRPAGIPNQPAGPPKPPSFDI